MSLLFTPNSLTVFSPLSPSRLSSSITISRVHKKSIGLQKELFHGVQIQAQFLRKQRNAVIVKASSEIDGAMPESSIPPLETEEEKASVEDLPLESKLQLKLEQKTKMKLAKKIRLRRKRLVRKRHLRKKGRWPPSKMKKNKNV